jgi:hypothetical protein
MKQVEAGIGRGTQCVLTLGATLLLGLEIAAFFGLPRIWYLVVNLLLVPALVVCTFWLHARRVDRKLDQPPGDREA